MSDVRIGRLDRDDLATALEWAAVEGWNPGVDDLHPIFAADPHGHFGAWVGGELAVTVSLVRYGDEFAFGGLYIASPAHRGHGIAYDVSRRALEHAAGCTVIGLDAVLEQEATYASDGFVTLHGTTRWVFTPGAPVEPPPDDLLDARDVPLEALVDYEVRGRMFPVARAAFLAEWLAMPSALARVRLHPDGSVRGWGLRRRCREGSKVGPLFADDADTADAIWRALVVDADGPVFLDVPDPNEAGRALVDRYGMAPVFSTRRMYRGEPTPDLALHRVFGVTTLELG